MNKKIVGLLMAFVVCFFVWQLCAEKTRDVNYKDLIGDSYARYHAYESVPDDYGITYRYIIPSASAEAMTVPVSARGYSKIALLRFITNGSGLPSSPNATAGASGTINILASPSEVESPTPQTYPIAGYLGLHSAVEAPGSTSSRYNLTTSGYFEGELAGAELVSASVSVNTGTQNWIIRLSR